MPYSFAGTSFDVAHDPRPVSRDSYDRIKWHAPGVDGLSAVIDDRRTETTYTLTVQATSYATYQSLRGLFLSPIKGALEIPENSDHWVYANAFVDGRVDWEYSEYSKLWRASVTFCCPDPIPAWKSTGVDVF